MCPTLQEADIYLVNRLSSLFQTPERGDIVVLKTRRIRQSGQADHRRGRGSRIWDGNIYVNGEKSQSRTGTRHEDFPFTAMTETVCGRTNFMCWGTIGFSAATAAVTARSGAQPSWAG